MKLIVWVKIEIEAGGVRVTDGNWRMQMDAGERMPDGDAVQIIERQLTERSITMPAAAAAQGGVVDSQLSERELAEQYTSHHTTGHRTDGKPAATTPRSRLIDDLQQIGVPPDLSKSLCDEHGAARIESLMKWMAAKSEPVGNPARLLMACLSRKPS